MTENFAASYLPRAAGRWRCSGTTAWAQAPAARRSSRCLIPNARSTRCRCCHTPRPSRPTAGGRGRDRARQRPDHHAQRSGAQRSSRWSQETQQNNTSPRPNWQPHRQQNLLRDMIDQQLLLSSGKELGINADAEAIRRLDEIRKQIPPGFDGGAREGRPPAGRLASKTSRPTSATTSSRSKSCATRLAAVCR